MPTDPWLMMMVSVPGEIPVPCHVLLLYPVLPWTRNYILSWIAVSVMLVFTVLSGFNYIKANWKNFTANW